MNMNVSPGPIVLASVLTGYPNDYFKASVQEMLMDESIILPIEFKQHLEQIIASDDQLDDLRSEYIAVFDHSKQLNPLYETEYGRERAMFKASELSDIAGFYRAFGFELDEEGEREMLDHISVELEFYSLLQMKYLYLLESNDVEGAEIVLDGMKKFLQSHLGRFVKAICQREGVAGSKIYSEVFSWVYLQISNECKMLAVQPEETGWFNTQIQEEQMCCGSVGLNK